MRTGCGSFLCNLGEHDYKLSYYKGSHDYLICRALGKSFGAIAGYRYVLFCFQGCSDMKYADSRSWLGVWLTQDVRAQPSSCSPCATTAAFLDLCECRINYCGCRVSRGSQPYSHFENQFPEAPSCFFCIVVFFLNSSSLLVQIESPVVLLFACLKTQLNPNTTMPFIAMTGHYLLCTFFWVMSTPFVYFFMHLDQSKSSFGIRTFG